MEIRRLRAMYPDCKTTLIEDRANGSAIITMLRREMSGIIAVQPIGSKMARVQAVLGAIESGNVHVPKNRRFTADFVDECSSFPNAAHDDQVDCMSQALNRLIYQRGNAPIIEKLSSFDKMFPQWRANRVKGHGKIKVV
jgi:predicted phage terminase large subunit-like protein